MRLFDSGRRQVAALLFCALSIAPSLMFAQTEEIITSGCRDPGSSDPNTEKGVVALDGIHQVNDSLIVLRNHTLYQVLLNSDSSSPAEVITVLDIPHGFAAQDVSNYNDMLLVDNGSIVVAVNSDKDGDEKLGFYFFTVNDSDGIRFEKSYTIDIQGSNIGSFYQSAKIVNGDLVMVIGNQIDLDKSADFINDQRFLKFDAVRQTTEQGHVENVNIAKRIRWVNSHSTLSDDDSYTQVFQCPLNDIAERDLQCDITGFFGVNGWNSYVSESGVYLWSSNSSFLNRDYGVIAHEPTEYLRRSSHESLSSTSDNTVIYHSDLNSDKVGAVLVDGDSFTFASFKTTGDTFSALLGHKYSDNDVTGNYGLSFSLDQFSVLPTQLPETSYSPLFVRACDVYINRLIGDYLFLSTSVDKRKNKEKDIKREFETKIWNKKTSDLTSYQSDGVMNYYPQGETVLGISENEDDKTTLMQVWSLQPELELLYSKKIEGLLIYSIYNDNKPIFYDSTARRLWGMPVIRLNDQGQVQEYPGPGPHLEPIIDMAFFESLEDGGVNEIGRLLSPSQATDDACEDTCNEWEGIERSYRIGDYVYAFIGNKIIKGYIDLQTIKPLNYFNIKSGKTVWLNETTH